MREIKRKFAEDSKVWFIDYSSKEGYYPEYGYVCAKRETDNQYIVKSYFGMVAFNEDALYATKEECEKDIYINKLAKEVKCDNPKCAKIISKNCVLDQIKYLRGE